MKKERLLDTIGNVDDKLIWDAASQLRKKRGSFRLRWAAWAACLCLAVGGVSVLYMLQSVTGVTAHAYGTEEEITASGAVMSTGTISDTGEVTGHPLLFFLSGQDIETVRFSCKNQQMRFVDWTEKRDEYGQAQNFTVPYGENESEYYFLLIDWIPVDTIRELNAKADNGIMALPQRLREDIIVMEIRFANGKTVTKAIRILLQDNGTFFASFEDYTIREDDAFIDRPDSPAIPRDILYGEIEPVVIFYDKTHSEVTAAANWYDIGSVDHITVQWPGKAPDTVRVYYTPAGTEMMEYMRLLAVKAPLDGESKAVLSVPDAEKTNMHGHLQVELDYGNRTVKSQTYNVTVP